MRLRRPAILPEKSQKPQAEHVKRSQKRGEQTDRPVDPAGLIGSPQNLVFAEESGKWRDAGNRKGGDRHGPERPGNLRAQSAHLTHILFAAYSVNHRTS